MKFKGGTYTNALKNEPTILCIQVISLMCTYKCCRQAFQSFNC